METRRRVSWRETEAAAHRRKTYGRGKEILTSDFVHPF